MIYSASIKNTCRPVYRQYYLNPFDNEGLHVGGVLNIAGTQIQEIPSSVSYGKLIADKSFHNKTFGVNRKAEMNKIMEELDDFDAFDWKPL